MQGEVLGDSSVLLTGFAPADRAQPGDITFAENADYVALAEKSAASAIIVDQSVAASRTHCSTYACICPSSALQP